MAVPKFWQKLYNVIHFKLRESGVSPRSWLRISGVHDRGQEGRSLNTETDEGSLWPGVDSNGHSVRDDHLTRLQSFSPKMEHMQDENLVWSCRIILRTAEWIGSLPIQLCDQYGILTEKLQWTKQININWLKFILISFALTGLQIEIKYERVCNL